MKSFDSAIKYDAIMKECVRRKYFYWKSHTKTKPESKEKHESQQRIYEVSIVPSLSILYILLGCVIQC